jgi:hypothetical protein
MKRYLYFNDGRLFYDNVTIRFEKLSKEKIPDKHLRFSIDKIKKADYPAKMTNYLSSVLPEEELRPFTFFLSQVIGGRVYLPIYLVGKPKTGKTVLLNVLHDMFKPIITEQKPPFRFENDKINHAYYLNNRLFIAESNILPKTKKCTIYDFKNEFNSATTENDILDYVRSDYENFILYLIFRYEDYIDSRMER